MRSRANVCDLRLAIRKSVAARSHDGASNAAVQDIGRGINFYDEVRRFEIDLIRRALEQTGGHQSRAARLAGNECHDTEFKDQDLQYQPADHSKFQEHRNFRRSSNDDANSMVVQLPAHCR